MSKSTFPFPHLLCLVGQVSFIKLPEWIPLTCSLIHGMPFAVNEYFFASPILITGTICLFGQIDSTCFEMSLPFRLNCLLSQFGLAFSTLQNPEEQHYDAFANILELKFWQRFLVNSGFCWLRVQELHQLCDLQGVISIFNFLHGFLSCSLLGDDHDLLPLEQT